MSVGICDIIKTCVVDGVCDVTGRSCDLTLWNEAAHKKKSVSCPACGQNCGQPGGRNLFIFFPFFSLFC